MLLRHVSDRTPGIRRHATRKRLAYFWPDGRGVRDRAPLARIRSPVLPPAWAAFGGGLPGLRRQVEHDLRSLPLSRARVLATVVRLLERTLIRIGNDEY